MSDFKPKKVRTSPWELSTGPSPDQWDEILDGLEPSDFKYKM